MPNRNIALQLNANYLPGDAAGVTPLAPPPKWLTDLVPEPLPMPLPMPNAPVTDELEKEFWTEPTPLETVELPSLPPAAESVPSSARRWGSKVLFTSVTCMVLMLLGLEALSYAKRVVGPRRVTTAQP